VTSFWVAFPPQKRQSCWEGKHVVLKSTKLLSIIKLWKSPSCHYEELSDREKRDIKRIIADSDYYCSLSEQHKTAAVSIIAVLSSGQNLEYVPETVINRDICRAAFLAKDADCSILPYIPYPDLLKEGIKRFSVNTPAFVLYSLADIQDTQMAQDAIKADAYCIQLVPERFMSKDLCKTALQSPNADDKISNYIKERFPELQSKNEQNRQNTGAKIKL